MSQDPTHSAGLCALPSSCPPRAPGRPARATDRPPAPLWGPQRAQRDPVLLEGLSPSAWPPAPHGPVRSCRGAQLGRQRRGGRLPCLGPGGRVTAARGRTEGRAAGPHGAGAGDPDGLECPGWAGGALQEPWCRRHARAPTGVPVTSSCQAAPCPPGARSCAFCRFEEAKRRETSDTAREGRAALRDDRSTPGEARSRPHHVTPRAVPTPRLLGPLLPGDPRAGRPQGVPAPCPGLGETRRTGRQPPQTPRQPPPPRPRARCARTRGERGQPPGAGAECGEGATWLEAAGPSSHLASICKS